MPAQYSAITLPWFARGERLSAVSVKQGDRALHANVSSGCIIPSIINCQRTPICRQEKPSGTRSHGTELNFGWKSGTVGVLDGK
jgi:hypothetical protein